MEKIFIGGVSCVGKDYILEPLIEKIEKNGFKYFHFGNEMKKYFPDNPSNMIGKDIKEIRNLTLSDMMNYDKIIVNGHYLINIYKRNDEFKKSINFRDSLKKFDEFVLITADFKEIKKRKFERDNKKLDTNKIMLEMNQEKREWDFHIKNKNGIIIYNQNQKLLENQKQLENYLFY